ncbi:hypothetical protein AOQ84DRAFT_383155 [Glonium stellatum]|uniref:Uncharacterized protein n=1 Tax=Glonium stellatum TaxID=574774 RepID=A0A8E2JLY9_9PEZI|nr:hypothetical protein AOQ84DRAFT_383155 [Glonium stellatum]
MAGKAHRHRCSSLKAEPPCSPPAPSCAILRTISAPLQLLFLARQTIETAELQQRGQLNQQQSQQSQQSQQTASSYRQSALADSSARCSMLNAHALPLMLHAPS